MSPLASSLSGSFVLLVLSTASALAQDRATTNEASPQAPRAEPAVVDVVSGATVIVDNPRQGPLNLVVTEPEDPDIEVDVYGAIDYLFANSKDPDSPATPNLRHHEMGISSRLRGRYKAWRLRVDYRGREPLAGEFENQAQRTLIEAQVRWGENEDLFNFGVGRFVAPAPVYLSTDGAWFRVNLPSALSLQLSGGRRAISSSRRNVAFDNFLPAITLQALWNQSWFGAEAVGGYLGDEIYSGSTRTDNANGGQMRLSGWVQPLDDLRISGNIAFIEQASFQFQSWDFAPVELLALGMWQAHGSAQYRPLDWLRARYDFLWQKPQVSLVENNNQVIDPDFVDNRVGADFKILGRAWLKADYRLRLRDTRSEHRARLRADIFKIWKGLGVRGLFAYDHLSPTGDTLAADAQEVDDRYRWMLSLGYRGSGFDVEAGVSFIERSGVVSGRRLMNEPGKDLSPFSLEAERISFARAFYTYEFAFIGIDFEKSIDRNEYRVFAQIGGNWWDQW